MRSACLSGLFVALVSSAAFAAPISVPNYSFETDARTDPGTTYNDVPGYTSGGSVPYLIQIIQRFDPLPAGIDGLQAGGVYIDNGNPTPPVPSTSAYLRTTSDLGTFAADTTYNLTLALYTAGPTGSISFGPAIFNGNTAVVQNLISDDNLSSGFTDYTVTLNTTDVPSVVGQPITVGAVFSTAFPYGRALFVDNVRLDAVANAIPEPASLSLLGPTMLLGGRRRR